MRQADKVLELIVSTSSSPRWHLLSLCLEKSKCHLARQEELWVLLACRMLHSLHAESS